MACHSKSYIKCMYLETIDEVGDPLILFHSLFTLLFWTFGRSNQPCFFKKSTRYLYKEEEAKWKHCYFTICLHNIINKHQTYIDEILVDSMSNKQLAIKHLPSAKDLHFRYIQDFSSRMSCCLTLREFFLSAGLFGVSSTGTYVSFLWIIHGWRNRDSSEKWAQNRCKSSKWPKQSEVRTQRF